MDDDLRLNISAICGELDVDGLRGDIVTNRSAGQSLPLRQNGSTRRRYARVITCS